MEKPQERLFTIRELAELLRVSAASVYELVKKGKIAVLRVGAAGGALRFRQSDVALYLSSCRVCNEPAPSPPPKLTPATPKLRHITLKK